MLQPFNRSRSAARRPSFLVPLVAAATLAWLGGISSSFGPARALAADTDEKEIPKPEEIELTTKDGVSLHATYYAGTEGKDTVPVILLADAKSDRGNYEELALYLQGEKGHAVVAVDLRGQGESTSAGNATLSLDSLRPDDYVRMVTQDVEAVKVFLMQKNNAGELNIDKLCIVGSGFSSAVAVLYAAQDWSWPLLGTRKQGQDVKALVLVSPDWNVPGLQLRKALAMPAVRASLSLLILVGAENSKAGAEAKRLYDAVKRYHPTPPPDEALEKQDLFYVRSKTSLQGNKLLGEKSLKLHELIADFIEHRLVKKKYPWQDRSSPLN